MNLAEEELHQADTAFNKLKEPKAVVEVKPVVEVIPSIHPDLKAAVLNLKQATETYHQAQFKLQNYKIVVE